ncbi:MAG: hypothetical protein M1829_002464 [Trizodia sp. TS-e1964]|nr:MAG: hypothetical protein M1829_002464 [Trizodia sp. TS-e1964]
MSNVLTPMAEPLPSSASSPAPQRVTSTLRNSLDPDTTADYDNQRANEITILHPGYPDANLDNVLLQLSAFDREGGGLHYGTALSACRIIAGNTTTGFFKEHRNSSKIDLRFDELLLAKKYYFYVSGSDIDGVYPIVPSFQHWLFPHNQFPAEWSAMEPEDNEPRAPPPAPSGLTAYVSARDKRCRVSEADGADYFTRAHLVPAAEKDWFEANRMDFYNFNKRLVGKYKTNDVCNAIALRADIHLAFDDQKFCIVPKESKWVVQFLGQTARLGNKFHNTSVNLLDVSARFLYARFAWTILPLLSGFLETQSSRKLLVRNALGVQELKTLDLPERIALLPELDSSSTRASAKKRRRETTDEAPPSLEAADLESSSDDSAQSPHAKRLKSERQAYIRARRPSNPLLICCDYNQADADARAKRPGRPEWGGRYLCDLCLGVDYLEDRDNDVGIYHELDQYDRITLSGGVQKGKGTSLARVA